MKLVKGACLHSSHSDLTGWRMHGGGGKEGGRDPEPFRARCSFKEMNDGRPAGSPLLLSTCSTSSLGCLAAAAATAEGEVLKCCP